MKTTKYTLAAINPVVIILVAFATMALPALASSPIAAGQIRFTGSIVVPACKTSFTGEIDCSDQWRGKATKKHGRPEITFRWLSEEKKAAVITHNYP
ncbi:hypothetical protein [Serratia symbiotica]|uniref:hypothetical protein n=1 Tax=Serratia symbiotica TaxID=138074 RepID=UPI001CF065B5|nr:hypothetical protein [Serratia symbiotica]